MVLKSMKELVKDLKGVKTSLRYVEYYPIIVMLTAVVLIGIRMGTVGVTQKQPSEELSISTESVDSNVKVQSNNIIVIEDLEVPLVSWVDKTEISSYESVQYDENIIIENTEITNNDLEKEPNLNSEVPVEEIDVDKISVPEYTVDYVDAYKMFTNSGLNLRSGPGTEYEVVTSVSINTELEVRGTSGSWSLIAYKDTEYFCSSKHLSSEKTEKVVVEAGPYDNYIVGEDGITTEMISYANDYWNKNVPNNIKEFLISNGWRIVISMQSLRERFGYNFSVAGLADGAANIIYIDNRRSAVGSALLHEIGHAIDFTIGYPFSGSYSGEFDNIYNTEKDNFVDVTGSPDYARSNPHEYFASVFANIILSPTICRQQCPETVAYIEGYIPK